jgi:uncharacterized protein YutE (UPF0331/DUF86 family)
LLRGRPGWNFELAVVGEGEKLGLPESARPMEREDILGRVEKAERLLELGYPEDALLLAWSALEATVRLLIQRENISLDHLTPAYILKQAVANGIISRPEYNSLMNTMKFRNALVHGFKIADFDSDVVSHLISANKRLLESTIAS